MEELSREEVHRAVDRVVSELLEAAGVTAPPVDAVDLALRHLHLDRTPRKRHRGGEQELRQSPEQRQGQAARRIGEELKDSVLRRLGLVPDEVLSLSGESIPNLIAAHLLLPAEWFATDARVLGHDLLALKERYPTAGYETIAWRMLDLSSPCVITLVDDDRVRKRRSNAWRVGRDLVPAERACQRYVQRHGRPWQVAAGGWTVQGWPIPETMSQREVLRSVSDEPVAE